MRIDLHVGKTAAQEVAYFRSVIERVQLLPGVRSAAAIGRFLKSYGEEGIVIEGRPSTSSGELKAADDVISGPYFQTAGIPLIKGRFFSDDDRSTSAPVAVINETMARNFWPREDPIGRRFRFSERESSPWVTVVGVAGDMRRQRIEKDVAPQILRPLSQSPDNELDLLVRTTSDPTTVAAAVRSEIQSFDQTVAKFGVTTVEQRLVEQTAERRFNTSLIGLFSLVALFLAAIGIYGLVHHLVAQRTHEIGVRMALGAQYRNVMAMVLRQGLILAAVGVLVGVFGAFGVTRMLSSLLYEVTATDPLTFGLTPAILLGVAALACWLPARRATQIDPMVALRFD